jgi:ABC-2 type transport system ATP-binding protein
MTPTAAVDAGLVSGMLQTGWLIRELSVREIVTMMASLYPHPLAVDEAMTLAGVRDLADRRTHKLSGGQTQRVRFALAIVSNPDLLVLDEPTVSMDVESRHEFWRAIRSFAGRGKTVVFATHYLDEADASADRIVLMAGGSIVADGPATEIKSKVGMRTIRATLPDVDIGELACIPGVHDAQRHGDAVELTGTGSDAVLRHVLDRYPTVRDIEVRGAGLEEAFLELTALPHTPNLEMTP